MSLGVKTAASDMPAVRFGLTALSPWEMSARLLPSHVGGSPPGVDSAIPCARVRSRKSTSEGQSRK